MSILDDLPDPDKPGPPPVEVPGRKQTLVKYTPKRVVAEPVIPPGVIDDDGGVVMPDEGDPLPIGASADLIRDAFDNAAPKPQRPSIVYEDPSPIAFQVPEQTLKSAKSLLDWRSIIGSRLEGGEEGPSLFRIMVHRKEPRVGPNNEKIAGLQGEFPWMPDDNFRTMFGGGKYTVTLYGPDPRGLHDAMGLPRRVQYAELTLDLPGSPVITTKGPDMTQQYNPNGYAAAEEAKGISRIAETLLKERLAAQHGGGPSSDVINILQTSTDRMLQLSREQQEAERRRAEEAIRAAREGSLPGGKLLETLIASKSVNEEVERVRRDYEDRIERVRNDGETQRQRIESALNERIRALEEISARREESLRSEYDRRERDIREQASRAEKDLRDQFERRERESQGNFDRRLEMERADRNREIDQMRRDAERDVTVARNDNGRNVEQMRRDHERDMATLQEMNKIALHMKDAELDRLRSDNASLKSEVETLRAKVYLDPISQIQQAHQLAEMTGMQKASDAPAQAGLGERIAEKLAENAPQLLQVAGPILARFVPGAAGGGAPSVPAMGQGPAPHQLGPGAPPQQRRQPAAPAKAPVASGRRVIGGPPPDEEDLPVTFAPPVVEGELNWIPSPPGTDAPPPAETPPEAAAPPAAAEAGPAAQPQQPQQQAAPQQPPPHVIQAVERFNAAVQGRTRPPLFTDDVLANFAQQATMAVRGGVDASTFAKSFASTVGADATAQATDWIPSGDACADMLEALTMGQAGWDMARQRQWIVDAWAELGRIRRGAAK